MKNDITEKLISLLEKRLELLGLEKDNVDIELSLFDQGLVDSISFVELIVAAEDLFNIDIDFSDLKPSDFDSIRKLSNLISDGTDNSGT